jgi:hypothetical protein
MTRKESVIKKITLAGANKQRCKITYAKGARFEHIGRANIRNIAPYEISGDYLMATDRKSGRSKIKSFLLTQIRTVTILKQHFIPMWEVKL